MVEPGGDAAEVLAECVPEGSICNGVDDDCDGVTDEGCVLRLGGHVVGGGFVSASDGELAQAGRIATRHFVGTSSDGAWVIRGGLPRPEEGP